MERDSQYDKVLDQIKETYEPLILAKLISIQKACEDAGLCTREPMDLCSDEFRWALLVTVPADQGFNEATSVEIEIAEQREHDGELDEDDNPVFGLNFAISVTHFDGKILGGVTPFNYTPFVWVDARVEDAVLERWMAIEGLDDFPIPTLIKEA